MDNVVHQPGWSLIDLGVRLAVGAAEGRKVGPQIERELTTEHASGADQRGPVADQDAYPSIGQQEGVIFSPSLAPLRSSFDRQPMA